VAPGNAYSIFRKLLYWWQDRADLLELTFKLLDKERKGRLHFSDFVVGVSPLCKGSLLQRLQFCFQMHDFTNENAINIGSLYNALDALRRIYISHNGQEEDETEGDGREGSLASGQRRVNTKGKQKRNQISNKSASKGIDLDAFVLLIFEKINAVEGSKDKVTFSALKQILIDTPLLRQFLNLPLTAESENNNDDEVATDWRPQWDTFGEVLVESGEARTRANSSTSPRVYTI
jgi:hypothetical protein